MKNSMRTSNFLCWLPRIAAILYAAFLSLFALDVFTEGKGSVKILLALGIHLIPSLALVVLILVAWRREWIGAVVFALLAGTYIAMNLAHKQWIAAIAWPMVLISFFYLLAWIYSKKSRAS